jgi:hypothetical protein
MSQPNAFPPPPKPPQPKRGLSGAVIAILIIVPVTMLICGGLCAGVVALYTSYRWEMQRQAEMAGVGIGPSINFLPGAPPPPMPVDDWWTSRVLAPVYTVAIDAVAANKEVRERLGEPVEPLPDAEKLYRRKGGAPVAPGGPGGQLGPQTIEFDIQGPKGRAVVSVVAGSAESGGPGMGAYRAMDIAVKFADESIIKVPPPQDQPGTQIQ